MTYYIENLRKFISEQVKSLIYDKLHSQIDTNREEQLGKLTPKYRTSSDKNDNTRLVKVMDGDVVQYDINNNPEYPANMIEHNNTPFDHIDRIILQDFSNQMFSNGEADFNYFKNLFTITFNGEKYGVNKIEMKYPDDSFGTFENVNYSFNSGEYIIDSFTYTPFVDYATEDVKVGVYSDEYLTKYNTGWYDLVANQVDKNRAILSSNLYELGNLENDIYNAKVSFRNNIDTFDEKVYIYTLCEDLFTLFAKLSNIRMSHLFYGLKHPHQQWDGMIALDIWYQMLYKTIDGEYTDGCLSDGERIELFNEDYLNVNPMTKVQITRNSTNVVFKHKGQQFSVELDTNGVGYVSNPSLTIMTQGVQDGYALVWDESVWTKYNSNSNNIAKKRAEHVLPRGVLKKIYDIVNEPVPRNSIKSMDSTTGDFNWFYQRGKVYSDSNKSPWTRYTNLHLGCAYDVMTAKQFTELTNGQPGYNDYTQNKTYVKSSVNYLSSTTSSESESITKLKAVSLLMLDAGCDALQDAFDVIKHEKLFNICGMGENGSDINIEEFNQANIDKYSQAQCAIVIERIFSRLYKYLQFKSTTGETFQRHINIDSGYKYLTTDTLLKNENQPNSYVYYNEDDEVPYLRYVNKILSYINNSNYIGLTDDEKAVLGNAINNVIQYKRRNWVEKPWELCPLCNEEDDSENVVNSQSMTSRTTSRESSSYEVKMVRIFMNLPSYMSTQNSEIPSTTFTIYGDSNKINYIEFSGKWLDLSTISLNAEYTFNGQKIHYKLLGYSRDSLSTTPEYTSSYEITQEDFGDDSVIYLYAIWEKKYIIRYTKGAGDIDGVMASKVAVSGVNTKLDMCGFIPQQTRSRFTYYSNPAWQDVSDLQESVPLYGFNGWLYSVNGNSLTIPDGGEIYIPNDIIASSPIITLTATWKLKWNSITFSVLGNNYCDVLIDSSTNRLVYPKSPVITEDGKKFIGWDRVQGDIMQGLEKEEIIICRQNDIICLSSEDQDQIVCSDGDIMQDLENDEIIICRKNDIICSPSSEPDQIVCSDGDMLDYDLIVNAYVSEYQQNSFNITFKYRDVDSDNNSRFATSTYSLVENTKIPYFHIHDTWVESETRFTFRYWRLESGNLSSSLTILSNLVFVAVYDEHKIGADDKSIISSDIVTKLYPPQDQSDVTYRTCNHCKIASDGHRYCSFCSGYEAGSFVSSPISDDYEIHVNCPLLSVKHLKKSEENDFDEFTVIDATDIKNLIIALFKVNIDIAHREYYLRVDIPSESNWWYGYTIGGVHEPDYIICPEDYIGDSEKSHVVCSDTPQGDVSNDIICKQRYIQTDNPTENIQWISFEPTVEYKFSNLHASNQISGDKLLCTVKKGDNGDNIDQKLVFMPVNRELWLDDSAYHFNELRYYYDYSKPLVGLHEANSSQILASITSSVENSIANRVFQRQKYYGIDCLTMYENTAIQSPVDVNDFIRHRIDNKDGVHRNCRQVQTYTSVLKKYRPAIVPNVRDIFNECVNDSTKYEVDVNNSYGVFGWCTIPSKTMVNMEYNEQSIIVPSQYDHHNRVSGSNFLQIDPDFDRIYKVCSDGTNIVSSIKESWYYLYNTRDWTYFLEPFFNIKPNNQIFSDMLDSYPHDLRPENSNHLNGVIFEPTNLGRYKDPTFGETMLTCDFLARHHHNEGNLRTLAEKYTNMIPYDKLVKLTMSDPGQMNSTYGSSFPMNRNFRFPEEDWVDDYDKTSSYIDTSKYNYIIGQRHAIDDGDEDSVWLYITMTRPIEGVDNVEIEDIMPYVFWWSNRGLQNNGPDVDCYGLSGSAKLNYSKGGYCYESSYPGTEDVDNDGRLPEERWHAVQHTLGADFSKRNLGGTILTQDNSGNVHKGAFDPDCSGSDEKWKIHHSTNEFGVNQHENPDGDRYYTPLTTHGSIPAPTTVSPESLNTTIRNSVANRPMTWNLWNIVRHYAYIKYFKNKQKTLGCDAAAWNELESYTRRMVKNIYRTYKERAFSTGTRQNFSDVDQSVANYGQMCLVKWTNSFVEISAIFERNSRDHDASFVLFTGDCRPSANITTDYTTIRYSKDNFVITTLNGVDDELDGMRNRTYSESAAKYIAEVNDPLESADERRRIYQGFKFQDMPSSYVVGDDTIVKQRALDTVIQMSSYSLDLNYPEAEYSSQDGSSSKWDRELTSVVMSKQIIPIYTNIETDNRFRKNGQLISHHDLTDDIMKDITFQVVPQMYWKYEWSFNEFMIHPVGKLNSPSSIIEMYDMLGNVWEWVRDDWSENVSALNNVRNPIVGKQDNSSQIKVIKGGAFDQLCRKVISSSREGLDRNKNISKFGTQANVGFRPSLVFTSETEFSGFDKGNTPVDLFFLFDASASQNNQIGEMIKSANDIVKSFAGEGEENKDICHVGSALFLGPTIKLMCSKLDKTLWKWVEWYNYSNDGYDWRKGYKVPKVKEYTYYNIVGKGGVDETIWNSPPYLPSFGIGEARQKLAQDWMSSRNNWVNNQGLVSRGDGEQQEMDYSEWIDDSEMYSMQSRGDGAGISGSSNSTPKDDKESNLWPRLVTKTYRFYKDKIRIHSHYGVPVWKISDSENPDNTQLIFNGNTSEEPPIPLFTYDLTTEGISTFDFPFCQSNKGCLSNWWAGCEPVSNMVTKLLKDGLFFGYPWNDGIGYMFRKGVPKLVFVFTNEFDNELYRKWIDNKYSYEEEQVILPLPQDNAFLFYVARMVYHTILGAENKGIADQNAPDPFCLQTMIGGTSSKIDEFLSSIGLSGSDKSDLTSYFSNLKTTYNIDSTPIKWFNINKSQYAGINSGENRIQFSGITNSPWGTDISKKKLYCYGVLLGVDQKSALDISNCLANTILTQQEIENINGTTTQSDVGIGVSDGIGYNNHGTTSEKYWTMESFRDYAAKTLGYYQLKNMLGQENGSVIEDPINLYLMVTNANAPELVEPLKDGETLTAHNIFLLNDFRLMVDMITTNLPDTITYRLNSHARTSNYTIPKKSIIYKNSSWTWAALVNTNLIYWNNNYDSSKYIGDNIPANIAKQMDVVFGGLQNPYRRTNIIYATRNDISKFLNKLNNPGDNDYILLSGPGGGMHTIYFKYYMLNNPTTKKSNAKLDDMYNDIQNFIANPANSRYVCPAKSWYTRTDGGYYSNNLDQTSVEIYWYHEEEKNTSVSCFNLEFLFSAESFVPVQGSTPTSCSSNGLTSIGTSFIMRSNPTDYVTISYAGGGTLKIVSCTDKQIKPSGSSKLDVFDSKQNVILEQLLDVSGNEMPSAWYSAIVRLSQINDYKAETENDKIKKFSKAIWEDYEILNFVNNFYTSMQNGLPVALAYRYQKQIFSNLTNKLGYSVTDYENKDNPIVFKAVPIMDFSKMDDIFDQSFGTGGNFSTKKNFSYPYCVIDLMPDSDKYEKDLPEGTFPMKFTNSAQVNTDEYKTTKIILSRIRSVSGEQKDNNQTKFVMGSSSSDYQKITDRLAIKYSDQEAITEAAKNDTALVTLDNGGSYQKKDELYTNPSLKDPFDEKENVADREQKYFKNKHLFIDPFELTIAQWCYVHGWTTPETARTNLGANLNEIARSYCKYMRVYENSPLDENNADDLASYNPLEDTRPYYYATYNDVRGTTQVYQPAIGGYVMNNSNGDEFQMNSRISNAANNSFMDILNKKVVNYTYKRLYNVESTAVGNYIYDTTTAYAQFDRNGNSWNGTTDSRKICAKGNDGGTFMYGFQQTVGGFDKLLKQWGSGEAYGINFDLPTEAQWEYACRSPLNESPSLAFPNENLGDTFETQHPGLDLISWYKYKVIGSKPEPERFATWRISKMLFGVTKDTEQLNNVYETT